MTVEDDWTAGLPEDLLAEIEAAQPGTVASQVGAVPRSRAARPPGSRRERGAAAAHGRARRWDSPARYWFEFFGPIEAYTVFAGGESLPSLVLTQARLPRFIFPPHPGSSYTVEISGGSVWILAAALDPALPGDRYVGFTVASGSLVFSAPPAVTGQRLTLAGALEATLEVKLATPEPPCTRRRSVSSGRLGHPPEQARCELEPQQSSRDFVRDRQRELRRADGQIHQIRLDGNGAARSRRAAVRISGQSQKAKPERTVQRAAGARR